MKDDTRRESAIIRVLAIGVLISALVDVGIKIGCNGLEMGWAGWKERTPLDIVREHVLSTYVQRFGSLSLCIPIHYGSLATLTVITAVKFIQNWKTNRVRKSDQSRYLFSFDDTALLLLTWLIFAGSYFVPLRYSWVSAM